MKKEDQAAFEKRQRRDVKKIKVGFVLLKIGSIIFFITSFLLLISIIAQPIAQTIDWTDFVSVFDYVSQFVILPFILFSAIGGLSYIKGKGPFISMVALMAAIVLFISIVDLVVAIVSLVKNHEWISFLSGLLSITLDGFIYFLGWYLSKDDFELRAWDKKPKKEKKVKAN